MGGNHLGKKSRKRSSSFVNPSKPQKPDEVFQYGPMLCARYGELIQMINTFSPEEHAEYMQFLRESHIQSKKDLEIQILELQKRLSTYSPLDIMYRASYELLPLLAKYRSENDMKGKEVNFLPMAEYLLYLVARTEFRETDILLSEDKWTELWNQTFEIFKLTKWYLFTRRADPHRKISEIEQLQHDLDLRTLMIRIKRYPLFFEEHLVSTLKPFASEFNQKYGLSINQFISERNQSVSAARSYTKVSNIS